MGLEGHAPASDSPGFARSDPRQARAGALQGGTSEATQPVNGPCVRFFTGTAADRAAGWDSRATRWLLTPLDLRDPTPDRQAVEQPSPRARKGGHRSASRARTPPKIAHTLPTWLTRRSGRVPAALRATGRARGALTDDVKPSIAARHIKGFITGLPFGRPQKTDVNYPPL